ncbi:radical SAM protein [Streptomyces sp. NPDC048361]|uniref:radical SAM protein n=1 Tax=Streptomyces sp. NPDC048361 TaxID=3154720 RepID=UPI00342D9CE7
MSTTAPVTTAPQAVDWTALRNFAALRGQFRVSLTPRCNLGCFFCHNEDDVPPPRTLRDRSQQPRRRVLTAQDFLTLIEAVIAAGLRRVYFSGGEPLVSPLARGSAGARDLGQTPSSPRLLTATSQVSFMPVAVRKWRDGTALFRRCAVSGTGGAIAFRPSR